MEVIFQRIIEHMKATATTTTTGAYILYKGTALTTSATDYTLGGQAIVSTFDSNANTSFYHCLS